MSWLDDLCATRRRESEGRRQRCPAATLFAEIGRGAPPRDFAAALLPLGPAAPHPGPGRRTAPGVIAEIKFASPSRGPIRAGWDVEAVARAYEEAGARALSVVTEESLFRGSLSFLARAKAASRLPVLCKDFLVDPYQVLEARRAGADAVLLIARLLGRDPLRELLTLTSDLGMAALVELHTPEDLATVQGLPVRLVGVNHRDLRTLEIDPARSASMASRLPPSALRVAESGLDGPSDLERMATLGYDAVLIGSHLMQQEDPGAALSRLLETAHASD